MTDILTQQMHEARARRLIDAETAAAVIPDLKAKIAEAEWRSTLAEDRVRDFVHEGVLPDTTYTVGASIPDLPDGPVAVVDLSSGALYMRHPRVHGDWRKLEPGAMLWKPTETLLLEGGPFLPIAQDAQALLQCVGRYDAIDRDLDRLAHTVAGKGGRENIASSAKERIEQVENELRQAERKIGWLTDERDSLIRTLAEVRQSLVEKS